jgi:hypothetical protein
MLQELSEGLQTSYRLWLILCGNGEDFGLTPDRNIVEIMANRPEIYFGAADIERRLAMEAENCITCRSTRTTLVHHGDREDELDGEEERESDNSEDSASHSDQDQVTLKSLKKRHIITADARCRRPSRKAKAPNTSIHLITLEPRKFQLLPRNRRRDYDDYYNGPSLEDMRIFSRVGGLESQPLDWFSKPTIRSCWELFRDWGYRLEPEFALMFACQEPQKVIEHILPLPYIPNQPQISNIEEDGKVSKMGMKDIIDSAGTEGSIHSMELEEDGEVCEMGMQDMLDSAGAEGSIRSMELFVKGKTVDGRWVKFNPKKDSHTIPPSNFTLSTDIDSIVITGDKISLSGDVEIEVLPYSGQRPPIPKSNHSYVELLMPQSEADIDSGGRSEWFSTRHSLSTIPHTHFAKINQCKISIHFPRMKHKDPITGRAATLIPWEVQSLFLVEVLYPAIVAGENPSTMPYKNYTLDEWKWKASNNIRFSGASRTVVVNQHQFDAIQEAMREIIAADLDELGIFASYYLVLEAKGIKLRTNCVIGQDEMDPYEMLCQKMPYIDFEHFKKRENGQLLMDLGLGFHPTDENGEALVCLWDLGKLRESYNAAGMNQGTTHHTNTMANYGGIQAEMAQLRSHLVQLCFRSSYCLHYETVRRVRGGEISFCDDVDAYNTNSSFMRSIDDYMKMLNGGRTKTFGVRDEIRGSGAAICQVLKIFPSLVRAYI